MPQLSKWCERLTALGLKINFLPSKRLGQSLPNYTEFIVITQLPQQQISVKS